MKVLTVDGQRWRSNMPLNRLEESKTLHNLPEENTPLHNLPEVNLNVLNNDVIILLHKKCQFSTMIVEAFLDLSEEK